MHYFHPLWIASESSLSQNAPNPFPPVSTQRLHASAEKMLEVIRQSQMLINKIVDSSNFSHDLMDAAQLSNQQKVDELIQSAGITIKVTTKFTPSGIHIELDNAEKSGECCKLQIALQW
ncbi:hypothetical protein [Sporosarcina sp. YIM B06819]|uniref:hypothetical protein n=1 Tax=Sporosarcina sp. YIM B06819 TaxID=3081769 RepID=UPI00298C251B|nr:hypothetical protein [Sporosarcina sp. YIM B06819]